jgi:hypothetical protein
MSGAVARGSSRPGPGAGDILFVLEPGNVFRRQFGQFPDDIADTKLHAGEVVGVIENKTVSVIFASLSFSSLSMTIV